MYETSTSTSTIFQKFQDFVQDYYDRKDVTTINLGSGIAREEFEKLLKAKVVKVFEKLWGFQINQVTYDRVRKAIDLGKLPQDFIDPLNAGIDEWIKEEWNPIYKEAMALAANGTAQITGMVGTIASATGVGVIFNPNTQRMIDIIDAEGLNLAVQLKKQQVMSLRTTLKRSISEKWTRKRAHEEMMKDVTLTNRENLALERFTQRQRNTVYKEFKKEFPKLTEKELNKRVEAVVKRRRAVKFRKLQNGRTERFYRTELSRAKFDGEIEGMTQAQEQGAIKNAKKKWVSTNNIDRWESTGRYNGKIVPIDGDFWKLYGKPEKTTMLDGKKPGEINELCILQYYAEKGDGKPVAAEKPKEIFANNFKDAEGQIEKFKKYVTPDEKIAIQRYTADGYLRINEYLNSGNESLLRDMDRGTIENVKGFLNRAPRYRGNVFRGKGYVNERAKQERLKVFEDNKIITYNGFISTSVDKKEIELFYAELPYTITYKIKSKNGVLISPLSSSPSEKEVLFNAKSKFILKNITVKGNNTIVSLEEI